MLVAIGGFDPGCGAGLARDIVTAAALGAVPVGLATAWTDQGPAGVASVEPRPAEAVGAGVRSALAEARGRGACAVKIGMVATAEIASAIALALEGFEGPIVIDPVLEASAGGSLYAAAPATLMPLLRRATLVTPNAVEAAALTGLDVNDTEGALQAALALRAAGVAAVLVKGGHLPGDPVDVLVDGEGTTRFASGRIEGLSPRGTGCALASAIAIGLCAGKPLREAVRNAHDWLHDQIGAARVIGGQALLP